VFSLAQPFRWQGLIEFNGNVLLSQSGFAFPVRVAGQWVGNGNGSPAIRQIHMNDQKYSFMEDRLEREAVEMRGEKLN